MENENKYEKIYQELLLWQEKFHHQNQKNIKNGIKCVIFVPLFFLALVFLTDSGKVVFLTLWIISMFLISTYLIYIEYLDFRVQQLVAQISQNTQLETQSLIGDGIDEFEASVLEILKQWEESLPPRKKIEDLLTMRRLALSNDLKEKLQTLIPENPSESKQYSKPEQINKAENFTVEKNEYTQKGEPS